METIRIAEVSIRKEYLKSFTYEDLMSKALNTPKYKRLNNAKELIDIELRKHGFKPLKKARKSVKKDNGESRRKPIQKRDTSQSKGNSRAS